MHCWPPVFRVKTCRALMVLITPNRSYIYVSSARLGMHWQRRWRTCYGSSTWLKVLSHWSRQEMRKLLKSTGSAWDKASGCDAKPSSRRQSRMTVEPLGRIHRAMPTLPFWDVSNSMCCHVVACFWVLFHLYSLAWPLSLAQTICISAFWKRQRLCFLCCVRYHCTPQHTHTFNIMCICIIYTHWHVFFGTSLKATSDWNMTL